MSDDVFCKALLKKIATGLNDGWVYNSIVSEKEAYKEVLTNKSGLYIYIRMTYGEKNPQLKIGYKHPKYKHFVSVNCIGCSFEKPLNSIISDIKKRLLVDKKTAYKLFKEETEKHQKANQLRSERDLQINALKMVFSLHNYHHSRSEAYSILNKKNHSVATITTADNQLFDLSLRGLNVDQIIKILQISNPDLLNK